MADDDLKVDVAALEKRFAEALRECPDLLFAELKKDGHDSLQDFIGKIRMTRFASGGSSLRRRSGDFSRAFDQAATGSDLANLRFSAGTLRRGLRYAWIQEYGGEIVPKKAKYLTIPMKAAQYPSGVTKISAREALSQPNVGFARSKRGNLWIVRRGKNKTEPLFLLVKRVRILGRLGFFDTWKRHEPEFFDALGKATESALQKWAARGDIKGD